MKVLFIGGTGNISSATSRLCSAKGMDLFLLNRGGTDENILFGFSQKQLDIALNILGRISNPVDDRVPGMVFQLCPAFVLVLNVGHDAFCARDIGRRGAPVQEK